MAGKFSERRDAEALHQALERYERLLAAGADADRAAREASRLLTPGAAPLFALADAVRVSGRPAQAPAFAARMEADLLAAHARVRPLAPRRSAHRGRSAGSMIMAFAACVAILAGVLVASSHSLPGDGLYGMKRASEDAQLAIVWGPAEAHVRLALAQRRLDEVQGLFARAGTHVLGVPGTNVAGALDDMDPHIAQLIRQTLAEAEQDITVAAKILITEHSDAPALGRLATIAHQGASIAKGVAAALPSTDKPPVLTTADTLAMVAVKAETVQQQVKVQQAAAATPAATPAPCVSPSPSPSPSATPAPAASASPAPTSSAAPSPTPAASSSPSPSATPCASPSPKPSAKPAPSATPQPATPQPSADSNKSTGPSPDGSSNGASQANSSDHPSPSPGDAQ